MPRWDEIRRLSGGLNNAGTFLVRDRPSGVYYVKKTITPEGRRQGHMRTEIDTLEQVKGHPNITSIWRADTENGVSYIGIEFCDCKYCSMPTDPQ